MAERTPAIPKKSVQSAVKTMWRRHTKSATTHYSLKGFVDYVLGVQEVKQENPNLDEQQKCKDWLFNKSANFSRPPLGLGCTRKKKSNSGGKK